MKECIFVSDLHGDTNRRNKLIDLLAREKPAVLFIGGDILTSGLQAAAGTSSDEGGTIEDFIITPLARLRATLSDSYPRVLVILGNDDPAVLRQEVLRGEKLGVWEYIHGKRTMIDNHPVYGYSYVPPTPFQLKDWEKYDVSRYVDPGTVSPEEGFRTRDIGEDNPRYQTIQADLEKLVGDDDISNSLFLFHSPPYQTNLDRAALDGRMIDHVPLDVHVGSIAIKRFIEKKQPLVTLHGHVHESARLMGSWRDKIGRTHIFGAAHDGSELAVIRFRPDNPDAAVRELL